MHTHQGDNIAPEPAQSYQRAPIYRVSLVWESDMHLDSPCLRSSAAVSELLHTYLKDVDREHFIVLMLDRKNRVIGINTVSVGSLTSSIVHPRELFKSAILANAAAVILGHNHCSGDPQPSKEDEELTARLVDAGELLGIQVLDHVIVGNGTSQHYSFADAGML
jgi:DNA repair protein RadC